MTLNKIKKSGHCFRTMPVFLVSLSTILGAILLLLIGYAVSHVGAFDALMKSKLELRQAKEELI